MSVLTGMTKSGGRWTIKQAISEYRKKSAKGPTLGHFVHLLLADLRRQGCRSWHDYRTVAVHYLGPLAAEKVATLSGEDIDDWLRWLETQTSLHRNKRLSGATRRKCLYVLSTFLERAMERRLIDHNPVRDVSKSARPKKKRLSRAQRALEALPEEVFRALILDSRIPPLRRLAWCGALMTGVRSGELCGLQVQDYELRRGEQTVELGRLTLVRQWASKRRELDVTKTEDPRGIPVHLALETFLDWRLRHYPHDPQSPLFLFEDGRFDEGEVLRRWNQRGVLRLWRKDLQDLDVRGAQQIRFHGARHTMISVAGNRGASDRAIESITHSAEPKSAYEVYLHFDWRALSRAISVLPVTPAEVRASLGGGPRGEEL